MGAKYYLKLTLVLFLVTAAAAGLLGLLNSFTGRIISQKESETTVSAMKTALPGASSFSTVTYKGADSSVAKVYIGKTGNQTVGYAVIVVSSDSEINMVVGVSALGKVTGVSIISMSDTPGLGASVDTAGIVTQFVGKSGTQTSTTGEENTGALTSASITVTAITSGVNSALEAVKTVG